VAVPKKQAASDGNHDFGPSPAGLSLHRGMTASDRADLEERAVTQFQRQRKLGGAPSKT
jgi:hypothetical protein